MTTQTLRHFKPPRSTIEYIYFLNNDCFITVNLLYLITSLLISIYKNSILIPNRDWRLHFRVQGYVASFRRLSRRQLPQEVL
ncbi:hypothetical protein FGO68_gene16944 [Halteria grandinella]|uniref:Uncharacterized protein n=1 Tax=Halteria grandinella TaxID=5974 RepID=A0A8J8P3I6_HALGN|nr:hypothetical protein FGO68_gene16944 [Halteria grandinella]